MLRYSYKVELKKAYAERLGLLLDFEKTEGERKETIRDALIIKEQEIKWIKENMHLHTKPEIM